MSKIKRQERRVITRGGHKTEGPACFIMPEDGIILTEPKSNMRSVKPHCGGVRRMRIARKRLQRSFHASIPKAQATNCL